MSNGETNVGGLGLEIGSKVGRYQVREKLAIGGQAIVYKCYDESLDRLVAVKQISPHLARDEKFAERFRNEAQMLARIAPAQPTIVDVYELVEDRNGLFIVMEYFEGRSLEAILSAMEEPVDVKSTLRIIWRLAGGLNAVHNAGIVHRDIKPSNILVGEGLKVKITDFGVAAATGQTSAPIGTTKYMSPEMFGGDPVDARADMYSLGLVAYEMLTGRKKFREIFADVIRDPESEALRWMEWHGNRKVSAVPLSEVNSNVPEELSGIVAKMIAKNPSQRFGTMEELGRAIKLGFSARLQTTMGDAQAPIASAAEAVTQDSGSADSSDPTELPPTLPLPKRPTSLRTKLIFAGACAATMVGIVVALSVRFHMVKRDTSLAAAEAYDRAMAAYTQEQYLTAEEQFADVAQSFKRTLGGAKASVMKHLAGAHQYVLHRDWARAQGQEDAAAQRLEFVQSRYSRLEKWARDASREISDFSRYRRDTWAFAAAVDKARLESSSGNHELARRIVQRDVESLELTAQQEVQRDALLKEIDESEIVDKVDSALGLSEDLTAQGLFEQALAGCVDATSVLDEKARAILSPEKYRALLARVSAASQKVQAGRVYAEAMRRATEARNIQDKPSELAALLEAAEADPSRGDNERIVDLRSEIALEDGRKLFAAGKLADAKSKFEEALKLKPDSEKARDELKLISRDSERREMIRTGTEAFEAGDFAKALELYKLATEIRTDETLDAEILEARFQMQLQRGDTLRDGGKFDEALTEYEKARSIKPDASDTVDARQADTRQRHAYTIEIELGDEALHRGEYSVARAHFQTARTLRPTPEADERIGRARYAENLSFGLTALKRDDLLGARAYFNIARGYMDTEDIRELIQQVDKDLEAERTE